MKTILQQNVFSHAQKHWHSYVKSFLISSLDGNSWDSWSQDVSTGKLVLLNKVTIFKQVNKMYGGNIRWNNLTISSTYR